MTNNEKSRLDRIEEKIDKMADAIIAIARVEEKLTNVDESTRVLNKMIYKQEERLRSLEQKVADFESRFDNVSRLFWILVSALSSALAYVWFGK
jgi:archaellum component FlaC